MNCLTCPVAHRFIAEYSEYYKKYRGRPKSQEHDNSVRTLNSIILTLKKKETENQYCADNLKTIITIIKEFLDDCDSNEIVLWLDHIRKHVKFLAEIERILDNNKIKTHRITLTKEEKKWSKNFVDSYYEDNTVAENTYHKIKKILSIYNESINKITYKRCSKIHANNPLFADIKFDDLEECFKKPVHIIKKPVRLNECPIPYDKLTEQNIVILESFLEKSPKKFSHIFKNVLEYYVKDNKISTTDLSMLYYGNNTKRNIFNNIQKGNIQNGDIQNRKYDTTNLNKKKLARILLVSEDVLTCGVGKIYGTWKIAINENKNKLFQYGDNSKNITGVLTEKEIAEFESKEKSRHTRIADDTKEKIYEYIRQFIDKSDDDFYSMIRDNPDFFIEEDFCAYIYEENDLLYYDYQEMYNQMLEPKSFDVLLSVLLELQESEKAEDEENNSVTPQEWLDIVRKQINNKKQIAEV